MPDEKPKATEEELRTLLPGSGDLMEMVNNILETEGNEDSAFTEENGAELLHDIIEWINA